jgi:hypothetical protein
MTSVAFVASVAPEAQLAFDLDDLSGAEQSAPGPAVKRNVSAGAPRLLRRLLAVGLDPDAIEHAAALVVALDREPTS